MGFTTLKPMRRYRGRGTVQINQWGFQDQGISRGFPKARGWYKAGLTAQQEEGHGTFCIKGQV